MVKENEIVHNLQIRLSTGNLIDVGVVELIDQPDKFRIVVDLVQASEDGKEVLGGNEFVRMTLDQKVMLNHIPDKLAAKEKLIKRGKR